MKRYKKALPAMIGILALFISAWSFAPRGAAFTQTTVTPTPTSRPLSFPSGFSEGEKAMLQSLYDFSPDISSITPGSLTGSDRTALDVMWAQNYNLLQMLRVAMDRSKNSQLRAHIRLLYQMRLKDQALLNQLEKQVGPVGGTATPGVTATAVGTTAPTSTAVATAVATEAATTAPTSTTAATTVPTEAATTAPTSTTAATVVPTEAATTAPTSTSAATTAPTEAAPTEAATTAPTSAATTSPNTPGYPPVPTATANGPVEAPGTPGYPSVPTEAATAEVTGTAEGNVTTENLGNERPISLQNVPILPNTALGQLGFHAINLERAFLDKVTRAPNNLFDPAFYVQMASALSLGQDTAQAVQISSTNPVLQAVANHLYKEDSLDQLLLQVLGNRIFFSQSLIVQFPGEPPLGVQNVPSKPNNQSQEFEIH